jgi:2-polyprenyl-6-hydroxyphenyl methylase/3-demethylubiquinone-9 3-methyltransferase
LEHLEDLESFVANSGRSLKGGGYFVHLFPCGRAPFALINRALPRRVSRKILYFFMPESKGICGFPAFYDRCYPSGIEGVLGRNGFEVVETRVSYYQSEYFSFFAPLYIASAAYELLVRGAGGEGSLRLRARRGEEGIVERDFGR